MSNEEVMELQGLRRESALQEKKVQSLSFELEDNELALKALESWKKFRWIGFFLALIAFAGVFVFAYLHLWIIDETAPGVNENYTDTIASSVSLVSIVFAIMMLIVLAVVCVIQGVRVFMELGESDAARIMAKARFRKNYHSEKERILDQRKILKRSMYEEEVRLKFLLQRLEELEKMEKS